jgi:hypothetical protein
VFELYALSAMLNLPPDASRAQLLDAMKDIIVGKAAYVGRFRQWRLFERHRLRIWDAVRGARPIRVL